MNLKHGINLGGFLSQCVHTQEHYNSFITEKDIAQISNDGFDHVRIPVDYEVLETEEGIVKENAYVFLKKIISLCEKYHLNAIIDLHKAYGYDFNNAGNSQKNNLFSNESLALRFLKLWDEISKRLSSHNNVAFELLNEVVEKENIDSWNSLINRAVTKIRKNAPEKIIIYGGIQWNSVATLKYLEPPIDKNILWTFHFYEPLLFTHQKAYWVPALTNCEEIKYPDSMDYYKEKSKPIGFQGEAVVKSNAKEIGIPFIKEMIQAGIEAAKKYNMSLYCGEFGVIDQAPTEDSLRWFTDVNTVFKEYNISYSVWNYKQKDFGIYDEHYASIKDRLLAMWKKA